MELTLKELILAFNKSPEDAIAYFEKLGIKPSGNWKDTLKAIIENAFAIAGIKNMDILLEAKDIIDQAIKDGTDLKEFKKIIQEKLELRNWHADLVVTQNVSNSYHAGTWTRQKSNESYLPLVVFYLGGRAHHTEGCLYLANNKIAVRINDPGIAKLYPSRHFRCGTTSSTVDEQWCKDNGYSIKKVSEIPSQYYNSPGFGFIPDIPVMDRTDFSKYPNQLLEHFQKGIK